MEVCDLNCRLEWQTSIGYYNTMCVHKRYFISYNNIITVDIIYLICAIFGMINKWHHGPSSMCR